MIRLNSFLHRNTLADIINRWMSDQPEPSDVRKLKQLVNFNCHIAPCVLDDVAQCALGNLAGAPVESFAVHTKGALKDFLVAHPHYRNHRIDTMVRRYQKYPQDFYRETPFDGRLYVCRNGDTPRYVGSTRRKRFKRIAEKSARRIIDAMFTRIKDEASALAHERAASFGVPIHKLITPPTKQEEEFVHAERRILKQIRLGQLREQMPPLDINDVFGVKAVCEDGEVHRLTTFLEQHPRIHIIECELHTGAYNAMNITLRYDVDKEVLRRQIPKGGTFEKLRTRGLAADTIERDYAEFVAEAEDHLILELIVSSYQETLESEVGRSIHEERVMQQRAAQQYRGSLASNVAALMEFMMALRRFLPDHIDEIPIKLWTKYVPDYFDSVMKGTYGIDESVYLDP